MLHATCRAGSVGYRTVPRRGIDMELICQPLMRDTACTASGL